MTQIISINFTLLCGKKFRQSDWVSEFVRPLILFNFLLPSLVLKGCARIARMFHKNWGTFKGEDLSAQDKKACRRFYHTPVKSWLGPLFWKVS